MMEYIISTLTIAEVMSITSVLATCIIGGVQFKYSRNYNKLILFQLNEKIASQQTKAIITAHLSSPERGDRKLLIRNEGNEKAMNIVVHKVIEDDGWLWHGLPTQDDPYGYLEPSQMFETRCSITLSAKRRSEVKMTWEDSNGPNETKMILSL